MAGSEVEFTMKSYLTDLSLNLFSKKLLLMVLVLLLKCVEAVFATLKLPLAQ